jgi:transcriptional regulator with XRE-family HTH domain
MLDFITIKEVKDNLGAWCRTLRKAEKLTKQQLAEELQVSRFTIAKLENGENTTLETLLKVLEYFDEMKSFNLFISQNIEKHTDNQSMY